MSTATKVEEKQCARCNGKSSKQWFSIGGLNVGLECHEEVSAVMVRHPGKKEEQLLSLVREEYKSMMRTATVTGMILNGMLSIEDMVTKGKITVEQFSSIAKKRYRGDDAKKIVKAMKEKNSGK